jgi:hypothetical protein
MTQEEKWKTKYNEVVDFIDANHRYPSRHRIEEHNVLKTTRKENKCWEVNETRLRMFKELLAMC